MSNAPSKPVSFSRPKVGYFSNRPRINANTREVCQAAAAAAGHTTLITLTLLLLFNWACSIHSRCTAVRRLIVLPFLDVPTFATSPRP